jgi:hypothetical protein
MDFMELERFVAPGEFMELGERLRVRVEDEEDQVNADDVQF